MATTWRNHTSHAQETKAVKQALAKAGYRGVKVGHGKGTAWAWLDLTVTIPAVAECDCAARSVGRCWPCSDAWRAAYSDVIRIAQEVTGRHGDYHGDIGADINFAVQ